MGIDLSQFHQTFLDESFEGLEVMESSLLNLDAGSADPDTINSIFRAAHSIKGGSATFGFGDVASFTHVLETLLDQMRSGERQVAQEAVDLLLQSVDCVREMLSAARDGTGADHARIQEVQRQLERLLGSPENAAAGDESEAQVSGVGPGGSGWVIDFRPHVHLLRTGNDPVLMFRELEQLGQLSVDAHISKLPAFEDMVPEDSYLCWTLTLRGDIELEQVREIFEWVDGDCDLQIDAISGAGTVTPPEQRAPGSAATASTIAAPEPELQAPRAAVPKVSAQPLRKATTETGSIRVSTDKVDALINMVGELVITQSMLGELGDDFDMTRVENLRDGLAELERNTRELQENVMRIRMLPISFAFNRFPRLVHDLSQKLGKQVDLQMSGEQTELDKTVMEKIVDPLVHLVRNSLDHGIETPAVRKAAGKPETGVLHLDAYHKGGNIVIEIDDDGAGLNKERILNKARANGLIDNEELSEEKIHGLIFQPGFSTAETVSDVSGRGVGMDVVRRNIKDLGGHIELESAEGKGSTIKIRLPLTLAIMDGQLVRVGDHTFIIPLVSITESLQVKRNQVNAIAAKGEVYKLRDEYIRIVRLYELFGLVPDTVELDSSLLVVVEGDGQKIGLFVDDLLNQQQIVIKSLETNFRRVEGLSGATILGDGAVALILDVPGLIELSRRDSRPACEPLLQAV